MKKIYALLVVMSAILFLFSCSQVAKNGYTIQGDDSLYVGETGSYSIKSRLGSTEPSNITWKISDNSIATLNNRGELTSLAEGVVTIFASFVDRDDTVSLKKDINITTLGQPDKGDEDVDFLIIGPEKLYKGQQTQLYIASLNSAKVDSVKWVDDGQGLVTFTDSVAGDIEVLGDSGEVVIKATVSSGGKEYEVSKTFPLYNGTLVLEYDISENPLVILPFGLREPSNFMGQPGRPIFHDFTIDWGDGEKTVVDMVGGYYQEGMLSHTYDEGFAQGTVEVSISGDVIQLMVGGDQNQELGSGAPWVDVKQWGNGAFLGTDMHFSQGPFQWYRGVDFSATDAPYLEGGLYQFFMTSYEGFNPSIEHWDMSKVTAAEHMFSGLLDFDKDLSGWDVSNVTNMKGMFSYARKFNSDISGWDVSNVTNMGSMFVGADSFDGDLSSWDVSNVLTFESMFSAVYSGENSDFMVKGIEAWNPSPYARFWYMFGGQQSLDIDLSSWEFRVLESNGSSGWSGMFGGTNLDPSYHPQGCTSDCGIDHP